MNIPTTLSLALLLTTQTALAVGPIATTDTFLRADTDGDGALSARELNMHRSADAPGLQPLMARHFKAMDLNTDGRVDARELATWRNLQGVSPAAFEASLEASPAMVGVDSR